jgi:peptidyl-prolyl cis-trans isomerase-like 4
MAVLLQTSLGDIVIDLYTSHSPKTCKNFLKLCKIKHYNNSLFSPIQKDFVVSIVPPGRDVSIFGYFIDSLLEGPDQNFFEDELSSELRHDRPGIVSMSNRGPDMNASSVLFK